MTIVLADHSGQGGNWWTSVVLAEAALGAGAQVRLLAPPETDPILSGRLSGCVEPVMVWDRSRRWKVQASYARNELTVRRRVPSDGLLLLSLLQFGIAAHERIVQYVHNPAARPMLGSPRLGRVMQRYTTTRSRSLARHSSEFGVSGRWLLWPHPVAPASFRPLPLPAGALPLATDRRNALVYGRAGSDENLSQILGWLADLTRTECLGLHLTVSREGLTPAARTALAAVEATGTSVSLAPRIPSDHLDAAVAAADAVLVPYETHAESVSGVGLIATAAGTPVVAGSSVNADLAWPPLQIAGRGAAGLRRVLHGDRLRGSAVGQDALAPWGRTWLDLLESRHSRPGL
jgi:hypothetical protein